MKVLVVVDMQNDFISGSLGTKEAQAILPKVVEKINAFSGEILFTRDTHDDTYLSTQEGNILPVPHCIKESTGWNLHASIPAIGKQPPIDKESFGSLELAKALVALQQQQPLESITLIGLCTDICVISNALIIKAALPEVPVIVDAACCAGVTPQSHQNALAAMKSCQVLIENE
ncbi:MAG: cysteine hydrolase [Clostridiales bacterium]|nr:cysteine hydrolase [Clostridiales bacterium]